MSSALCMFSGGKDSTVALAWTLNQFDRTTALSFNYAARPGGESRAAARILQHYSVQLIEVDLPFVTTVAEMKAEERPAQTAGAYAPMRNLVFHSVALCVAEARAYDAVVAGHVKSDSKAYVDASQAYLTDLYRLAHRGRYAFREEGPSVVRLEIPLIKLEDREVIALGKRLRAPLHLSWSCLGNQAEPCGMCISCKDRRNALQ